jgi:hypothetical protein
MDQRPSVPDQPEQAGSRRDSLIPEVIDRQTADEELGRGTGAPFDDQGQGPFAPYSVGGGRARVYGCSPGCLIVTVVVSLILTLLLNAIF